MDAPSIRVELQRHSHDCGVAVLAMLLGVSYEQALAAVAQVQPQVLTRGLTWREMRQAARRFGYDARVIRTRREFTETGALSVRAEDSATDHLVVAKNDLIIETDGSIRDTDVFFAVTKARPKGMMVFERRNK